mmetsp:Transcript_9172/g.25378  ORF Transcript_9172/g.25378 Transcript_9172/m.25378 type:complete len:554 (+) Transcript_9172:189-1850(+)
MGNAFSEEEEKNNQFLEEGFNLEDPGADAKINIGAAAPRCQPQHTEAELKSPTADDVGHEVGLPPELNGGDPAAAGHKHNLERKGSSGGEADHRGKRQHTSEAEAQAAQQQKLSYIQMAKLGYQELVNAIIRPPRAEYKMEALGPPAFNFCGKRFTRTDFTLQTKRGYNLECSHWEPVERAVDRIPVVIYMHGNSSARVEVIPQLSYLLSLGVAVFAFDFAGSGKSDGEYVSLGYYEREDLSCIVAHLRATNVVSTIALWGRSMGAATSLMFGDRDPSIACMILDSPFADLGLLCEEMVEKARDQGIMVPGLIASVAIRMLQGSVKKQAGFNIRSISPITHADKCFIPALFVAGEHDDFIKKSHSEAIYEKYAGDKNLIIVEGDHNSPRPKFMFDSASIFLQTCLQIPNEWALQVPMSMNLMCPPWYFELYKQRQQKSRNRTSAASQRRRVEPQKPESEKPSPVDNGYDHEEMGMTSERQRVIQASLFKMLGQADGEEGEGDDADEKKKEAREEATPQPTIKTESAAPMVNAAISPPPPPPPPAAKSAAAEEE